MAITMNAQVREGLNKPVMDNVPSKPAMWHKVAKANTNKKAPKKANYLTGDVLTDGVGHAYAFIPWDYERWSYTHSFVKFGTNKPGKNDMTKVADFPNKKFDFWVPSIPAQTFVGDQLWSYMVRPFDQGYYYPMGIYNVSIEDGTYHSVARWYRSDSDEVEVESTNYDSNKPYLIDMSYDPTNDLVWYIAPKTSVAQLYSAIDPSAWTIGYLDPKDPSLTPHVLGDEIPGFSGTALNINGKKVNTLCNLIADHGKIYAFGLNIFDTGDRETGSDGTQYMIPGFDTPHYLCFTPDVANNTYTVEVIRSYDDDELDMAPVDYYSWSSYELDRDNRRAYLTWNSRGDGCTYFSEVELETGKILSTVQQGETNFNVCALAFPFQKGINDDAPANVTKLSVVAGIDGAATASLSWTLPTGCYYDRKKAPQVTSVKVFRDDKCIATLEPSENSYDDEDIEYGFHKYYVVAYNAAGEGLREGRTLFVGRDFPGAPTNVTLTHEGNVATVTWQPSAVGANGTWYDKESLVYDVVRNPGNVTVATDLKATTFSETVTAYEGYTYTITAKNHEGVGLSTVSNKLAFGPAPELPIVYDFEEVEDFNKWEVIDANHDGTYWQWGEYYCWGDITSEGINMWYGNSVKYDATQCRNKPFDYFVSPLFKTVQGQQYKITYDIMTHNYCYDDRTPIIEEYDWYNGNAEAVPGDGFNQFHGGETTSEHGLKWMTREGTFRANDNEQRVALAINSVPNTGILYLRNIIIREFSKTDLSAYDIRCSELGNVGTAIPVTVTVRNEGSATVKGGFKVRVFDEAKTSVAETEVSESVFAYDDDNTLDVIVEWTPKAEGHVTLFAEVVYDADTYKGDNVTKHGVNVGVTESEDGVLWRTVGKNTINVPNWINLNSPFSISQAIYYGDELMLEEGDLITAVGFMYYGAERFKGFDRVQFSVDMGNTGIDQVYDFKRYAQEWTYVPNMLGAQHFPINVFYGTTAYNVTEGNGILLFEFDDPFEYEGENVLIQVTRNESSKVATGDWNGFQCEMFDDGSTGEVEPRGRALYYTADVAPTGTPKGLGLGENNLPVLYFGYKKASGDVGIRTIAGEFTADFNNGVLSFGEECSNVVVSDLQGRVIARAAKAERIALPEGQNGAVVVSATLANGKKVSAKVAL